MNLDLPNWCFGRPGCRPSRHSDAAFLTRKPFGQGITAARSEERFAARLSTWLFWLVVSVSGKPS